MLSLELIPLIIMLNATPISTNRDSVIWSDNPNGFFSIASGYFSIWDSSNKPPWANAWISGLTPKINIFLWLLLQDKILSLDNLAKKGQIIPNRCSLYKLNLESINHLFIHCPFSSKVWNLLTRDLGFSWCHPDNIQDFFI